MIQRSDEIKDIVAALSKFQGQLKPAIKDSENEYYENKYADLESVWEAIRIPLAENGLAIVQTTEIRDSRLGLVTTLFHTSSQWMESFYPLNPVKGDPQSLGSCVSYARRYCLASLLGVVQADDDAALASGKTAADRSGEKKPPPEGEKKNIVTPTPKQKVPSAVVLGKEHGFTYEMGDQSKPKPHAGPSQAQIARLYAIAKASRWDEDGLRAYALDHYSIDSFTKLTRPIYDELCNYIEKNPCKQNGSV